MTFVQTLRSLWNPLDGLVPDTREVEATLRPETFLKRVQLKLRRRLSTAYPGQSLGMFRGYGLELKSLREYQPGDEVRKMDWNVLARTGIPHVKEHFEERQIPVWVCVDATDSMGFGGIRSKLDYARELVELLGFLALQAGHRIGLILWTGQETPVVIPPKSSFAHLQWILQTLQTLNDSHTHSPESFPDLGACIQERAVVFLLSDLMFLTTLSPARETLARLTRKHHVSALMLIDPVEEDLIYHHGLLPLSDAASKTSLWVDTNDRWLLKSYRKSFRQHIKALANLIPPGIITQHINTRQDPVDVVMHVVKAS